MDHFDRPRRTIAGWLLLLATACGGEAAAQGLARVYDGQALPWRPPSGPVGDSGLSYRRMPAKPDAVSFNRIPAELNLSYPSLSAASTQTGGLGEVVLSSHGGGYVDHVEAVLVTWAKADDWPALKLADPTGYSHRVTAGFYVPRRLADGNFSFTFVGESSSWIHVPWRPLKLPDGSPYPYNGHAFKVTVPFLEGWQLPVEYAVLISFNTERTGYQPLGVPGPYNQLNHALAHEPATVGVDPDSDVVLWVQGSTWRYPASNWSGAGAPMLKVGMRATAEPPGIREGSPVEAGHYHLIAGGIEEPSDEAFAVIGPAPATVGLSGLATSRHGGYQGPLVTTIPAGLAVRVTYDGSQEIPDTAGTYRVRAVVEDPNYQGEAEADLTVSGPRYDDWIALQLPGTADRAPDADPDGDGLVNRIEYGLGLDPSTPGKNPLLEWLERRDAIVIGRQRDLPGTALVVEQSRDLKQWEELPGEVVPIDAEREGLRISRADGTEGKCFFRLRVRPVGD